MLPAVRFPDAELVVVDYLRDRLPAGTAVGTEWPDPLEDKLPVVAASLGGGGTRQKLVTVDRTVDFDILAAKKKQARDLAAEVSALLIAAQNTVQSGARIYSVEEVSLVWLPYQPSPETDPIPRYVLVMGMVIRPA